MEFAIGFLLEWAVFWPDSFGCWLGHIAKAFKEEMGR